MSIGERISDLRAQRNISQVQLAKQLGISRQAVSKWENDLTSPDTLNLIKLADVLDTDVEYLATGNHGTHKAAPEIITVQKPVEIVVEKIVEKPVVVEKIVEKPVVVEKIVEVEITKETIVEKPIIKRVTRTKYLRNPIEFLIFGVVCFGLGLLIGLIF